MKKAAVFNDLSGFGKCSLTAAIPVLSAQGVQCCPMASAVLTNQTGYEYHKCTDLTAMIKDYIDNWQKNNAHFDGIYSGFMTGSKQIELFMDFLDVFYEENTMLLVDPVMGDDGRTYGIYSAALLDGMKALSRKADVITPNLTEACLLADYDIEKVYSDTRKDVLLPLATEISEKLRDLSGKNQDVYRKRHHNPQITLFRRELFGHRRSVCLCYMRKQTERIFHRGGRRARRKIPV